MKKLLMILCLVLFSGTDVVWAQSRYPVFSGSLAGGGGYYTRRAVRGTVYHSGTQSKYVAPQPSKQVRKKTVLKYEPGQVSLSEEQMEELMPLIRRLQDGKVKTLEVIGICREINTTTNRQRSLANILRSYSPNMNVIYRQISGAAVVKSNDNTMEIVEYW